MIISQQNNMIMNSIFPCCQITIKVYELVYHIVVIYDIMLRICIDIFCDYSMCQIYVHAGVTYLYYIIFLTDTICIYILFLNFV